MKTLYAKNLAKSYKKRKVVIDVSMEIKSGQIVGLLGPNGAGKTTCFYMIVGLVAKDKGQILIDDLDISNMPMHGRAQAGIGYLPQEASIFRKLTVYENILGILQTRKELSKQQQQDKANALIDEFHIGHIRDSQGMALSGGERRRVEIARALATEPDFILLDEPFAGVDAATEKAIIHVLKSLKDAGRTVVVVHHDLLRQFPCWC